MEYLTIIGFLYFINEIGGENIDCPNVKNIYDMNPTLKQTLNGIRFWTKKYYGKTSVTSMYSLYPKLVLSEFTIIGDTLHVDTFSNNNLYATLNKNGEYEHNFIKCLWNKKFTFTINDNKAIFRAHTFFSSNELCLTSNKEKTKTEHRLPFSGSFEFALVHISKTQQIYVFQACNSSYAWVNVEYDAMKPREKKESFMGWKSKARPTQEFDNDQIKKETKHLNLDQLGEEIFVTETDLIIIPDSRFE